MGKEEAKCADSCQAESDKDLSKEEMESCVEKCMDQKKPGFDMGDMDGVIDGIAAEFLKKCQERCVDPAADGSESDCMEKCFDEMAKNMGEDGRPGREPKDGRPGK